MRYAFCFQVAENGVEAAAKGFVVSSGQGKKHDKSVGFHLGPWRGTVEEAEKDRELYERDREAFFALLDREQVVEEDEE